MKNFKDYPKDLQRIVELTPEGWPKSDANCVHLYCNKLFFSMAYCILDFEHHRDEYEACRAAYLHETADDIKAGEVDWRSKCEELTCIIEGFIEMWDGPTYAMHMIENIKAARPVAKRARAALEATK